jgi:molecular chaperone DnaK (HSP70)
MTAPVVGIDLGTTHAAVATSTQGRGVRVLEIEQQVSATGRAKETLLPCTLYAGAAGENQDWLVGRYARTRATEVEGRAIASAKSWLAHAGVDRSAAILPWTVEEGSDVAKISPVEASRRILQALAHTWSDVPDAQFVLTVPASFDAAARELTLLAAKDAGLSVHLLEEPLAAFYNYLEHADELLTLVKKKARPCSVLVLDVGGGTTDMTLLTVSAAGKKGAKAALEAERTATGPHLLLGGDNMDLALAYSLSGDKELSAAQFTQLVFAARAAKERLLGDNAPDVFPIALGGAGAKLVGNTLRFEVHKRDVETRIVDGFFPMVGPADKPRKLSSALMTLGLPYERDAAITRHIAAFLVTYAKGELPDAVLLNGGVFHASAIVARIAALFDSWGGGTRILSAIEPDLAVAKGAVRYGLALQGEGVRVRSRVPKGYYLGVEQQGMQVLLSTVPRGTQEGEACAPDRAFELVRGTPVRFELYVDESGREDPVGVTAQLHEGSFRKLLPLVSKIAGTGSASVSVRAQATEHGTLSVKLLEKGAGEVALEFSLGAAKGSARASLPPLQMRTGQQLLKAYGAKEASHREVVDLPRALEKALGDRAQWTVEDCRSMYDALFAERGARRRSQDHERVFWSLLGYFGRPGLGAPEDDRRIRELFPLFEQKLAFPERTPSWQAFFVAFRRMAAGFSEKEQSALHAALAPFVVPGAKKPKWSPTARPELLTLLVSLERVDPSLKQKVGDALVESALVSLSRPLIVDLAILAARVPAYGSAHQVVGGPVVEGWLELLLRTQWAAYQESLPMFISLARVTGDPARDLKVRTRELLETKLRKAFGDAPELAALRENLPLAIKERDAYLGESLPLGLRLE